MRSSFIVGFPGETDDHVEELAGFLEQARLDWAGFFPYSAEDGTPAALLPGRIDVETVSERHRYLQRIQDEITVEAGSAMVGRRLTVLIDQVEDACRSPAPIGRLPRSTVIITIDSRQAGRLGRNRSDRRVRIGTGREKGLRLSVSRLASRVSRLMIVEVLAVGTELLLGQIVNGNAAKIGTALADHGFDAHFQVVVGDNLDRVAVGDQDRHRAGRRRNHHRRASGPPRTT